MKVFILDWVDDLTTNYHSGGGLVVVARDLSHAKELAHQEGYDAKGPTDEEWAKAKVIEVVGETEPSVHVHEDAGCC